MEIDEKSHANLVNPHGNAGQSAHDPPPKPSLQELRRKSRALQQLPQAEAENLLARSEVVSLGTAHPVVREGEPVEAMFVILRGTVSVHSKVLASTNMMKSGFEEAYWEGTHVVRDPAALVKMPSLEKWEGISRRMPERPPDSVLRALFKDPSQRGEGDVTGIESYCATVPFFRYQRTSLLRMIAKSVTAEKFQSGEPVQHAGEPISTARIVIGGSLSLHQLQEASAASPPSRRKQPFHQRDDVFAELGPCTHVIQPGTAVGTDALAREREERIAKWSAVAREAVTVISLNASAKEVILNELAGMPSETSHAVSMIGMLEVKRILEKPAAHVTEKDVSELSRLAQCIPFFRDMGRSLLPHVLSVAEVVSLTEGEDAWEHVGVRIGVLLVLKGGIVAKECGSPTGMLLEGDWMGANALKATSRREKASVGADELLAVDEPCELLFLSRSAYLDACRTRDREEFESKMHALTKSVVTCTLARERRVQLAEKMRFETIPIGACLVASGSTPSSTYLILRGEVGVWPNEKARRVGEKPFNTVEQYEFVGIWAVVNQEPSPEHAFPLSDEVLALVIGADMLRSIAGGSLIPDLPKIRTRQESRPFLKHARKEPSDDRPPELMHRPPSPGVSPIPNLATAEGHGIDRHAIQGTNEFIQRVKHYLAPAFRASPPSPSRLGGAKSVTPSPSRKMLAERGRKRQKHYAATVGGNEGVAPRRAASVVPSHLPEVKGAKRREPTMEEMERYARERMGLEEPLLSQLLFIARDALLTEWGMVNSRPLSPRRGTRNKFDIEKERKEEMSRLPPLTDEEVRFGTCPAAQWALSHAKWKAEEREQSWL